MSNLDKLLEKLAADQSTMARHGLDCLAPGPDREMGEAILEQEIALTDKATEEVEILRAKAVLADEISAYQRTGVMNWLGWTNWFSRYDAIPKEPE